MTNHPTPLNGLLLINKPTDWTSHDVVAYVRRVTGIKQIGHTGTLDPLATGLLILLIGPATKQAAEFHKFNKTYEATIKLGVETDTYDRLGQTVELSRPVLLPVSRPTLAQINQTLLNFTGDIQQQPPAFSAKKIKGRKAYELARRGLAVELKPATVHIHKLAVRDYAYPYLKLTVTCSSGTYIRSLAHDLGQQLNCGAALWELQRTAIGPYALTAAVPPQQLTKETAAALIKTL